MSAQAKLDQTAAPGNALSGAQCVDCGRRMYPARMCCVSCFGRDLKPVSLGDYGVVDCCTTVHQAPPGYEGPVPYVLAMVRLGNDLHVLSHLVGKPPHAWRRGDAVRACSLVLRPGQGVHAEIRCPAFQSA